MKKFYNTIKKRKMVFLILMVATALMVGACGKKNLNTVVYPLELFVSGDVQTISDSDLKLYEQNNLKSWEENGECESARINSDRRIEIQYTDAQLENAKSSMVDVLNMNPSANFMGTADLSVAYSKDFTRLVVTGQEKDLQERVLVSQDKAALLLLQIMNGVSCEDAQVVLALNYTDTGRQEVKELNCYNY